MRGPILIFLLVVFAFRAAPAAELVMFESSLCEWCELWEEEVGVVYGITPEARMAPLRRVSVHDETPADLGTVRTVIYTPTFVLMDKGREIGRITGYPGEAPFWGLLEGLIGKLEGKVFGCQQEPLLVDGGLASSQEKQAC